MSSSDYIALRRLRRTVGNRPFFTEDVRQEQAKVENINCIYNNKSSTPGEILQYFDVAPTSLSDLSTCLSSFTYTATTPDPIIKKPRIIQIPLYCKNRTIIKKPCVRSGYTNAAIARVCGTSSNTTTAYSGDCDPIV